MTRTPKTLDEAIQEALCVGPLTEVRERAYGVLKDFITQKVCAAFFELELMEKNHKNPEQIIQELYLDLTKRAS